MRVKIGDIIEFETKLGLTYAQFTHYHTGQPKYGALLRIFDKIYESPVQDLHSIAFLPVRFNIFFRFKLQLIANYVELREMRKLEQS